MKKSYEFERVYKHHELFSSGYDRYIQKVTHRVRGVWHGVKWPEGEWELIHDKVICLIFGLHNASEALLVLSTVPLVSGDHKG